MTESRTPYILSEMTADLNADDPAALRARLAELERLLLNLTPGGSEFVNPDGSVDAGACARFTQDRGRVTVEAVKRRKAVEARVTELEAKVAELEAQLAQAKAPKGRRPNPYDLEEVGRVWRKMERKR